jgi:hypothetical protein
VVSDELCPSQLMLLAPDHAAGPATIASILCSCPSSFIVTIGSILHSSFIEGCTVRRAGRILA